MEANVRQHPEQTDRTLRLVRERKALIEDGMSKYVGFGLIEARAILAVLDQIIQDASET